MQMYDARECSTQLCAHWRNVSHGSKEVPINQDIVFDMDKALHLVVRFESMAVALL